MLAVALAAGCGGDASETASASTTAGAAPNRAPEPARRRSASNHRPQSANIATPGRPTTPKPAPNPDPTTNSRHKPRQPPALGGWRELAEPQVRVSAKTGPGTKIAGFGNDFLRNGPFAALTWGYAIRALFACEPATPREAQRAVDGFSGCYTKVTLLRSSGASV